MSRPSFLPLLNSIAVNEGKAHLLLNKWAEHTRDEQLKSALRFVAIREGEHAMAFTKRMSELGFEVDESSAFQVFKDFDDLMQFLASDASDADKVRRVSGGEPKEDEEDVFSDFMNDRTMDPATGALMGRYIAEERDSGRRLLAEYQRVCGQGS